MTIERPRGAAVQPAPIGRVSHGVRARRCSGAQVRETRPISDGPDWNQPLVMARLAGS
jgi:hypothetical protein